MGPHTLAIRISYYWVSSSIPIRLPGLHTGLQLQTVYARPARSQADISS